MALELPNNMDDLAYFTRRKDENWKAIAWVEKESCKKCKKGLMEKPKDAKTGKPKIRALEYMCNSCGHVEPKVAYEATLTAHIIYTCPSCHKDGEQSLPFKRKTIAGVSTLRGTCEHCGGNIDITKKMKEPKAKKK